MNTENCYTYKMSFFIASCTDMNKLEKLCLSQHATAVLMKKADRLQEIEFEFELEQMLKDLEKEKQIIEQTEAIGDVQTRFKSMRTKMFKKFHGK